jgi:hypothetical protein
MKVCRDLISLAQCKQRYELEHSTGKHAHAAPAHELKQDEAKANAQVNTANTQLDGLGGWETIRAHFDAKSKACQGSSADMSCLP